MNKRFPLFGDKAAVVQLCTLIGAQIVFAALVGVFISVDNEEDNLLRVAIATEGAVQRASQLDEMRTASAKLYVTTSRPEYHARFEQYADELDRLNGGLVASLGDEQFKRMVAGINVINRQLVDMELRAFALSEKGSSDGASEVLHDDLYQRLKQQYGDLSSKALQRARAVTAERLNAVHSRVAWVGVAGELAVLLLSAVAFRIVLSSQRRFRDEHAKLLFSRNALAVKIEEHEKSEQELRQTTQELRASETRHRLVLQGALDAVVCMDSAGNIVDWNVQAEQCFGWSREEVLGRSLADTIAPPDLREAHMAGLQRHLRTKTNRILNTRRDVRAMRKDGSEFLTELAVTAADVGNDVMFTAFLRDITERRAAEAELRNHRDNLQQMVESRTHDLMVAKEAAEQANQAKSTFLANMSHEIRTPMNAIIGLSHLALKGNISPKQRDYLAKIHESGTSLLTILNDILDFAKVEAGKLDLEVSEFELDTILSRVAAIVGFRGREKGLTLSMQVANDVPPWLLGDGLRLQQILVNLVSNSVKFTERGEVRVKVARVQGDTESVELQITVSDTGIGMSREQSLQLFQPFYQADVTHTRKYGGTGLGLTICKRLVSLMHGHIEAESVLGLGTKITATIRLGVGQAGPPLDERLPATLRNLRAMVVDDNAACADAVKGMLESLGYEAVTVSSAEAAMQQLTTESTDPFDIVFMDWKMPEINGIEAARLIRARQEIVQQPSIVMVTAYDQPEVRNEAKAAAVDGYLVKPVSASMLVDSLVEIFAPNASKGKFRPADVTKAVPELANFPVLLVEDNKINQQIAIELLQEWGAEVTVAENGAEALRILEIRGSGHFNVVLMDIQMPVMDGYEACKRIREQPQYNALPLIAMTAHALVQERDRCIEAGMNDYVSKPIDPQLLLEALLRWGAGIAPSPVAQVASAEAEPVPKSVVDFEVAVARFRGRHALLEKIVKQVLDDYPDAIDQMQGLLAEGQKDAASRHVHTLAGLLGYCGAVETNKLALMLENAIKEEASAIEPLLAKLAKDYSLVRSELQRWLEERTRSAA